jgi:hypothetical protein
MGWNGVTWDSHQTRRAAPSLDGKSITELRPVLIEAVTVGTGFFYAFIQDRPRLSLI